MRGHQSALKEVENNCTTLIQNLDLSTEKSVAQGLCKQIVSMKGRDPGGRRHRITPDRNSSSFLPPDTSIVLSTKTLFALLPPQVWASAQELLNTARLGASPSCLGKWWFGRLNKENYRWRNRVTPGQRLSRHALGRNLIEENWWGSHRICHAGKGVETERALAEVIGELGAGPIILHLLLPL